jgi:hypothetical protein
MPVDFTSIKNATERTVCETVMSTAPRFPGIADNADLLADVACVALNRLQPRYIRHHVDFSFYLSERERSESERQVCDAVEFAFGFVQARTAMRARA